MFAFDVVHETLEWPWITFSADARLVAYASSAKTIASLSIHEGNVAEGRSFQLPEGLSLGPFSIHKNGAVVALLSHLSGVASLFTLHATGEQLSVALSSLVGEEAKARAIAFDRTGARIWISLETANETVLLLIDTVTLEKVGELRSPALPRPSLHELHIHPYDDAVLLVAACGESGTFARVGGFAGDVASSISTDLDVGGIAAGFVGFSFDGARVHLAEVDELRTHSWPGLHELSTVPFADDFVANFSGATLDRFILIDGEHADVSENAVMIFDHTGIRGALLPSDAPSGMWAGKLVSSGTSAVVTVESKGDPARAHIWRAIPDKNRHAN